VALTIHVIAQRTVAEQIEDAWKAREGLLALDNDPTFCKIVEEVRDHLGQRARKAITRGYPRYAFAA
jgi:hypothetical protein